MQENKTEKKLEENKIKRIQKCIIKQKTKLKIVFKEVTA